MTPTVLKVQKLMDYLDIDSFTWENSDKAMKTYLAIYPRYEFQYNKKSPGKILARSQKALPVLDAEIISPIHVVYTPLMESLLRILLSKVPQRALTRVGSCVDCMENDIVENLGEEVFLETERIC